MNNIESFIFRNKRIKLVLKSWEDGCSCIQLWIKGQYYLGAISENNHEFLEDCCSVVDILTKKRKLAGRTGLKWFKQLLKTTYKIKF